MEAHVVDGASVLHTPYSRCPLGDTQGGGESPGRVRKANYPLDTSEWTTINTSEADQIQDYKNKHTYIHTTKNKL